MATVQMTAPIPIMMPSMVSAVRILLRASAARETRRTDCNCKRVRLRTLV